MWNATALTMTSLEFDTTVTKWRHLYYNTTLVFPLWIENKRWNKSLKRSLEKSKAVNGRSTHNTMTKRKKDTRDKQRSTKHRTLKI